MYYKTQILSLFNNSAIKFRELPTLIFGQLSKALTKQEGPNVSWDARFYAF